MSKPSRTTSLASFLTLTLVGGYIAVELLYFAHSGSRLSMAAGLRSGSDLSGFAQRASLRPNRKAVRAVTGRLFPQLPAARPVPLFGHCEPYSSGRGRNLAGKPRPLIARYAWPTVSAGQSERLV
jgi:hypothetical protein